jgi:hypothetical protein
MLLGMMVVGTSATSINDFTDADEITQQEAVAITTGLGIFDGYDTGDFKPNNVVTRAEMAVIIAKILHGVDIDPSNFAGAGKFTDVPEWAEGYVNLVAALGIIVGVGDNKFDPNATVTTAEASTMLLKALGYYTDAATQLGSDWALTTTSKATALGLYGDLSLGMNDGLTRENVAVLTFNALFAQLVAYDNNRVLYVKANDRNVVVTNGTNDETNTLAYSTFGLYSVEGTVVANGYTQESLLNDSNVPAQTKVAFETAVDLDKDGKATDLDYDFNYSTGLDMIGHAVKVYYMVEKKAPVVYAVVDEATLVGTISAASSGNMAKAANALGFKKDTVNDVIGADASILNYDMDVTVDGTDVSGLYSGKTLVLISNSNNLAVDYVIVLDQYLDKIKSVDEDDDEVYYELEKISGYDYVLPTDTVAKGDYVVTTKIGGATGDEDIVVAQSVDLVSASITRLIGTSTNPTTTLNGIVADGTTYAESPVTVMANLSDTTPFQDVEKVGAVTLILDETGKLIGLAEASVPDIGYAFVAQFGWTRDRSDDGLKYEDKLTALIYYADGTSDTRVVDLTEDATDAANQTAQAIIDAVTGSNSISDDYDDLNAVTADTTADGTYIGIYYIKEKANGSVKLVDITKLGVAANTGADNDVMYSDAKATVTNLKLTKGHALQMDKTNAVITFTNSLYAANSRVYANNDTVFFYVDGVYGSTTDPLTVVPVVGIANAYSFTNADNVDEYWITTNEVASARNLLKAALVEGLELGASTVYFYNEGNFHAYANDAGKGVVEFYAYALDGTAVTITYDQYTDVAAARTAANAIPTGYYTAGSKQLNTVWATDGTESGTGTGTIYAVGAIAEYSEIAQNLISILDQGNGRDADDVENWGIIFDDAKVIDLTGNGINSVAKLINATKLDKNGNRNEVEIAYNFSGSSFVAGAVFVTAYNTKANSGSNTTVSNGNAPIGDIATVSVGNVNYRYTNGFTTIEKAVANAATYSLSGQASNNADIDISVLTTTYSGTGSADYAGGVVSVETNSANAILYGNTTVTTESDSIDNTSGSGTAATASDVVLTEGNYIVVGLSASVDDTATVWIAIEVVK